MFQFRRSTMKSEKASSAMRDFTVLGLRMLAMRFLQFVLALTVCGLYGQDLNNARKAHKYADSKWVYAVAVAGLSAFTALVYMVPKIKSFFFSPWDLVLFILWLVVFGIFGKMYIKEDPEGDAGITRMKHAVWVDLINMLLWIITAVVGLVNFWRTYRRKTLHTGAAPQHP